MELKHCGYTVGAKSLSPDHKESAFLENITIMYYFAQYLRGDFLQTCVSGAQKSNESDSKLRNLGKVKMAGNSFIVRVFPGSIYKHNRCGLVPF